MENFLRSLALAGGSKNFPLQAPLSPLAPLRKLLVPLLNTLPPVPLLKLMPPLPLLLMMITLPKPKPPVPLPLLLLLALISLPMKMPPMLLYRRMPLSRRVARLKSKTLRNSRVSTSLLLRLRLN
jgi:hypothetical protein